MPLHLRSAGVPALKHYGMGVGYRYPHEYEGADVEQQYLPDELVARRYYLPTDHGYEATIGERMERRATARTVARETGRTPKDPNPGPKVSMRTGDSILRTRESNRKKLAETERRDAAD